MKPAAAHRRAEELRAAGAAFAATLQVDPGGGSATPTGDTRPMPADYAELLDRVGPGLLAGTLRLLAPAAAGPADGAADLDMDREQARHADRIRARRADHRGGAVLVPAPFAPEPGGLRLWGVFRGGETCWWLPATRDPASWPLLLVQGRRNVMGTSFPNPPLHRDRLRPGNPGRDLVCTPSPTAATRS